MRIDMHIHTNNFFRRNNDASALVKLYKKLQYDGFVSTDHFKRRDFDNGLTLERYWAPYYSALEYGRKVGFKVFSGAEVNIAGNDYLVYGMEPDSFRPLIRVSGFNRFIRYIHKKGGLVYQAHPLRSGKFINLMVDGYELNMHPKYARENQNDRVKAIARMLNKPCVSGSDAHRGRHAGFGFVNFNGSVNSNKELACKLRGNDYEQVC